MKFLVSAKGEEFTAWRAAQDFSAAYRQAVLDEAASGRRGAALDIYSGQLEFLEQAAESHRALLSEMDGLTGDLAGALPAGQIKDVTGAYYALLYRHFSQFRSPLVFYRKSADYLKALCNTAMQRAADQLGLFARHLPDMALIALGAAGRVEFSPTCRLQLMLVHGDAAESRLQNIALFCHALHDELTASGLNIDPDTTPRTPHWRGDLATWQQRCDEWGRQGTPESLTSALRLADQFPLILSGDLQDKLKNLTHASLRHSRPALAYMVVQLEALSNGLGIMGGLKLEKSGPGRGLFNLLEHGLIPLSSALTALTLITNDRTVSCYERIFALLNVRELDVDMTEKAIESWHTLHDLRLSHEGTRFPSDEPEQLPLLDPERMNAEQLQLLKNALTTVASLQRHTGISFSGSGE